MNVLALHPQAADLVGLIPFMLSEDDPRSAREQLDANYQHGGGWSPLPGWTKDEANVITYPGDPPLMPVAVMRLRAELIFVYQHAWVAIVQTDGSFEVARMD